MTVQDVVFEWDPVQGAKQYEIWIALDHDFNNSVEKRIVIGTRYSPITTYDNDNYFWKVRPINAANQPAPWPAEPQRLPAPLAGPADGRWPPDSPVPTVGDDFYYQWTPVQHASKYRSTWAPTRTSRRPRYSTCFTAQTTYAAGYKGNDPCMPEPGPAVLLAGPGARRPQGRRGDLLRRRPGRPDNQGYKFVYSAGVVNRLSPANGDMNVDVPTLRWAPSQDAEQYDVKIYDKTHSESMEHVTTALSWTPAEVLDPVNGPFSWSVTAIDSDGKRTPLDATRTFNVGAPPATGTVAAPDDGHRAGHVALPAAELDPGHRREVLQAARVRDAGLHAAREHHRRARAASSSTPSVTDDGTYFLTARHLHLVDRGLRRRRHASP